MDGRWDQVYAGAKEPAPYGDTYTYDIGVSWLAGCRVVEDWGCGYGWFAHKRGTARTVSVDGSATPFADVEDDLRTRDTQVEGIFLRHVLEHNAGWDVLLRNACQSFTRRMCVVIFTPFVGQTEMWYMEHFGDGMIPTYRFSFGELLDCIPEDVSIAPLLDLPSPNTSHNVEHVLLLSKESA